MLKREHDDDSAYSGDGSNADSGRGGSDEGDGAPPRGMSNKHVHGESSVIKKITLQISYFNNYRVYQFTVFKCILQYSD